MPRVWRSSAAGFAPIAALPQAIDFSYLYSGFTPNVRTAENVAIVTIEGPLEHHATWMWDSYESILERVESAMTGEDVAQAHKWRNGWREDYEPMAACPARAVILKVDSPGGEAAGMTETHKKLRRLRAQYDCPLYAFANEMACSAAYGLSSACDELWLPEGGVVGSIGVIATMFDRTRANTMSGVEIALVTSGEFKADGHADRVLTDEILGRTQDRVYELATLFWDVVARARGTTRKAVQGLQAATFCGQTAVDVGIADGVASWDRFLRMVTRTVTTQDDSFDAAAADAAQ